MRQIPNCLTLVRSGPPGRKKLEATSDLKSFAKSCRASIITHMYPMKAITPAIAAPICISDDSVRIALMALKVVRPRQLKARVECFPERAIDITKRRRR